MIDWRDNLHWITGSVSGVIAAIISWFYLPEVSSTLIGVVIGAGITYFVQIRTQKRAWKREYSVKIAETVYGSLYREVKWIIWLLENKSPMPHLNFEQWGQIQEDHRYFMVDEGFRNKLDSVFERVRRYNDSINGFRSKTLPTMVSQEIERIFYCSVPAEAIRLEVIYKDGTHIVSASPKIVECLISQLHPKDYVSKTSPEIVIQEFHLLWGQTPASNRDEGKFDEFWESSLRRMKEDKTYQFIIEESGKLLEEARKLKKEIVQRIEEPWRI